MEATVCSIYVRSILLIARKWIIDNRKMDY